MSLIGIASIIAGIAGAAEKMNASFTNYDARNENYVAEDIVRKSNRKLMIERKKANDMLELLGKQKINILENSMSDFVDTFSKIKNVNFNEKNDALQKLSSKMDYTEIEDLRRMRSCATQLAKDSVLFTSSGVLLAFGTKGVTKTVGKVAEKAVIKALETATKANSTMTFLNGGTLVAEATGVTEGVSLLGGALAGPALLVTGFVSNLNAKKNMDNADSNLSQSHRIKEQLFAAADECKAIMQRAELFCMLLDKLDAYFIPAVEELKAIVKEEGMEFKNYLQTSKGKVATAASLAITIKTIIDTNILEEDGSLSVESKETADSTNEFISAYLESKNDNIITDEQKPVSEEKREKAEGEKGILNILLNKKTENEFAETDDLHEIVGSIREKYHFQYAYSCLLGRIEFWLDHHDKKIVKYLKLNNRYEEILLIYRNGIFRLNKGFVLTDMYLYDIQSGRNVALKDIVTINYKGDTISVKDKNDTTYGFACECPDSDGKKVANMLTQIIDTIKDM